MNKRTKIRKIILLFSISLNILFFASPILPIYAADCPDGKVLIIGDSLAKGIGNQFGACSNVKNVAVEGSFTRDLAGQFNANPGYNTLIVMSGYNDAHANTPTQTSVGNLRSIYSQAKDQKMTVVALTEPTLGNAHPDKVSDINKEINNSGVTVLNSASMWATSGNVHNSNSYKEVANAIKNNNYPPGTGTSNGQTQTPAPTQTPIPSSTGTTPISSLDTTAPPPEFEPNPSSLVSGSTACEIWKNAFNLGISFIGVAALAGVIWGGFGYITSYGNQDKIKSAKDTIWGSVGGMFIGLFAYALFSLVNPYVLQCKIDAPFKLSISGATGQNPSGTGQQGQGQGQVDSSVYANAKKCSAQLQPSTELDPYFIEFGNLYGLDPHFLKATAQVESGQSTSRNFGPYGDGTSVSGAGGPMQFMPGTTDQYAPSNADPSCHSVVNKGNKLSAPFNSATATGYCNSSVNNYDPNCCTPCAMAIGSKNCQAFGDAQVNMKGCSRYAGACLNWMWDNKKEDIKMAAHFLADKYKRNGSYAKSACSYQGGGGDSCKYSNKVMSNFAKFCQQSGGTIEQ